MNCTPIVRHHLSIGGAIFHDKIFIRVEIKSCPCLLKYFKKELEDYIQHHNHRRINVKLKGMSPVDFWVHALKVAY
ncbi:IS3 family transposase [Peribacillus sp. NPDC006672]|uniref:IS3 family transposase n=1 Tax=Peribacillus sp. NPDC006672 TaxID=3390606 RepID=UPI003D00880C